MKSTATSTVLLTAVILLVVVVGVSVADDASTKQHQQHHHAAATIHVLPPSPDDTPVQCEVNATLYESCGTDRFCSRLFHNDNNHSNGDDDDYYCLHKTLWMRGTLDGRDLMAFFLTGIFCFLAAMGGIGGGGLILPILLIFCNFTPKEASVLSNTAVFSNTLGQFCVNTRTNSNNNNNSNNQNNANAIVYATVLMIMPGVIAGGSVAITLEGMVPSTIILVLALLTLLLASTKTYYKAQKMRQAEQREQQADNNDDDEVEVEIGVLAPQPEQQQHQQDFYYGEDDLVSPLPSPRHPTTLFFTSTSEEAEDDDDEEERIAFLSPSSPSSAMERGSVFSIIKSSSNNNNRETVTAADIHHDTTESKGGGGGGSKKGLLNLSDTSNSDIMEETFFGSIRFLNREETDDNFALIIDESSIAPSVARSTATNNQYLTKNSNNTKNNNNNNNNRSSPQQQKEGGGGDASTALSTSISRHHHHHHNNSNNIYGDRSRNDTMTSAHSVRNHVGFWGKWCWFCSHHKLELLLGTCWMMDATTFLVLHAGTLVPPCSTAFYSLVAFPALVAVIFVGLGRWHLMAARSRLQQQQRAQQQHHQLHGPLLFNVIGGDDEEVQPLMMMMSASSLLVGSEGENDERQDVDDDLVPNLAIIPGTDDHPSSSTGAAARASLMTTPLDRNWVVTLLPLLSVFAGIMKALRYVPSRRRDGGARSNEPRSDQELLSVPLLAVDQQPGSEEPHLNSHNSLFFTRQDNEEEEESLHDDYKSLLAWWLPWAAFLIGLLSALLGIGGGELLGPILLLLLRMDPQQSSATTAIMSMMNSGTNLLHYIVADMMTAPGYAVNLAMAGLIGGSGGRLWAMSIAQKGRSSIIAMSLCGVLSLGTALVAWELITTPLSWESKAGVC